MALLWQGGDTDPAWTFEPGCLVDTLSQTRATGCDLLGFEAPPDATEPLLQPQADEPRPGTERVLEELALRRHAARTQSEEVWFEGTRMTFRISQSLSDTQGQYLATGFVTTSGTCIAGGGVELASTPVIEVTGPVSPDEAAYLQGMGIDLIELLKKQCRGGRWRPYCDCCPACGGRGGWRGRCKPRTAPLAEGEATSRSRAGAPAG